MIISFVRLRSSDQKAKAVQQPLYQRYFSEKFRDLRDKSLSKYELVSEEERGAVEQGVSYSVRSLS